MADPAENHAPSQEDLLRAEIARQQKIINALMNRAERSMSAKWSDFGLFQTTVTLENLVRERTAKLEAALQENEKITRALEKERAEQLTLIRKLEEAHCQLLQSEKLASIGQLAAGVAHEINNPIGFVNSNLGTLKIYVENLIRLIDVYAAVTLPLAADPAIREHIDRTTKEIDLDFLREDIGQLISESVEGTTRVRRIVQDLRDFSRTGEEKCELADLRAGLESTLNVVWNEIKYKAEVKREYGEIPMVECRPSQINQVFMNLLVNAAQAIRERGTITLRSGCRDNFAWVAISDTGQGIAPENVSRIFDPFFTTKPVGKGTGLGLSVSYGIIDKHGGRIEVSSEVEKGTTFTVWLPLRSGDAES